MDNNTSYETQAIDINLLSVLDITKDGKVVSAEKWVELWNLVFQHINKIDAFCVDMQSTLDNWHESEIALNEIIEDMQIKYNALSTEFIHYGENSPENPHIMLWVRRRNDITPSCLLTNEDIDISFNPDSENAQSGKAVSEALSGYVVAEVGKGLSSNDFTNEDKEKLNSALQNEDIDQTYSPTSTNAQSGKAVAEAINAIPQTDWQQNDETANDYIKNRPGGYTGWKQVYRGPLNGTFATVNEPLNLGKNRDKKYKVIFDGVEYICTVKDYDGYIYLGNLELLINYAGTNETEPFLILDLYNTFEMYASTDNAHSIYIFIEEIVKIPESYLEINNTNLVNGSSTGSLRTTGSFKESTSYTMGDHAFAEGTQTTASGGASHAEGSNTTASAQFSHAEGFYTKASSNYQHVQGKCNIEDNNNIYADIIGNGSSNTKRSNAATVDWKGNAWYAGDVYVGSTSGANKDEGSKKLATEEYVNLAISSGGGTGIVVDSELSSTSTNPVQNKVVNTALGTKVDKVSGKGLSTNDYTPADKTKLSGIETGANKTVVDTALSDTSENPVQNKVINTALSNKMDKINPTGTGSFSLNRKPDTTVGTNSHAEGYNTEASGSISHAEGDSTTASADTSHAEGYYTTASADTSHAEGYYTTALGAYQHVQGKYNISDSSAKYADIVGNGYSDTNRSNAATVDWNGNASYAGTVKSNGADYAEFFEWLDGNPNNEDRVGYLVALDGEKIRFANPEDEILGIISANPAILGDNYEWNWNGKYLTDEFGRILYDKVEEFIDIPKVDEETGETIVEKKSLGFFDHPRINPDYDPDQEYINRRDRSEWAMVGMFGKLLVRDDGTAQVDGYINVGENGIATASVEKTNIRVLSRINDHIVKVLLK